MQDGSITTTQIDELVDVVFVQFDADSNGWLNNTEYDAFSSAVYTSTLPSSEVVIQTHGTPLGVNKQGLAYALTPSPGRTIKPS